MKGCLRWSGQIRLTDTGALNGRIKQKEGQKIRRREKEEQGVPIMAGGGPNSACGNLTLN